LWEPPQTCASERALDRVLATSEAVSREKNENKERAQRVLKKDQG